MRGLGGAGESSVWAQPEAAMPCLAWPCKVPRAVVRHVNASTVHGSSGYALRVFSVLSTWGLTARFDDFPTGLRLAEDVVVDVGSFEDGTDGRRAKAKTRTEAPKKPNRSTRGGIRAIRRLGGPAELPARCGGAEFKAITRSVPHHPRERRRRRPGPHRSQVDT